MQCEEFEIRLNEALDRRLPLTTAEALEHQRVCAPCGDRAAAYSAIARQLASATVPAPPEGIAERVLAQLRPPATVPLARRHRPRWALAAAAVLLVSLIGAWSLQQSGWLSAPAPRQMARRTNDTTAKRQQATSPMQQASAHPKNAAEVSPPAPNGAENKMLAALPDAATQPAAEWAQQVADGLQPVMRPTLGAATGFLQVWGVGQNRPPSGQGPRS